MPSESDYYESEGLWEAESVRPEDLKRIRAIIGLIPEGTRSILDVGCGNGTLLNTLLDEAGPYERLHGVDRSEAALRHVRTERTPAGADELPFPDRAFDLVTCLEVVEHLPVPVYEHAIAELCRVSSGHVILSVPNDQDLEAELIQCPSCKSRFHPYRHVRAFTDADVRQLLANHGFVCDVVRGLGEYRRPLVPRAWGRFRNRHPGSRSPYPFPLPCAVCQYSLPPRVSQSDPAAPPPGLITRLKSSLRNAWPAVERTAWLVGVFRRSAQPR